MRLLITGGPRTGKTTRALDLAQQHGVPVYHTDDAIPLGWHEASAEVARWLERPGPWIIEGVAVPRALRKWLASHPSGIPCEQCIVLRTPHIELHRGQIRMMQGLLTVLQEIAPELRARGMEIVSQ
jgi:adenylate kinase family enzyme